MNKRFLRFPSRGFWIAGSLLLLTLIVLIASCNRPASTASQSPTLPDNTTTDRMGATWIRQFGSVNDSQEAARSLDIDPDGNIYISGETWGMWGESANIGSGDNFIRKYDSQGNELWTRRGASYYFVSASASGVYASGNNSITKFDIGGNKLWTYQGPGTSKGICSDSSGVYMATISGRNAIIDKVSVDGNKIWSQKFELYGGDICGISVSPSGLYVAGTVAELYGGYPDSNKRDACITRYDTAGTVVWTRKCGTMSKDTATSVFADANGIYVIANASGAPVLKATDSSDVFVYVYDFDGNEEWRRQIGNSDSDFGTGVSADATGIYILGSTRGDLTGQGKAISGKYSDVFLRKYDFEGKELWTRQFSSPEGTSAGKICTVQRGFYIAGMTKGSLGGQNNAGGYDAYLRKYDTGGNELWTRLCGFPAISGQDYVSYPAIDSNGNIYVVGYTYGIMPGQTGSGIMDGFVRKYDSSGRELWTRQFDKSILEGVAVDATGVYMVGHAIRKFDTNGNELWTRLNYSGRSVCVGTDGVYVASSGKIIKFDTGGNEIWTQKWEEDTRGDIYADSSGVYVAGYTSRKDAYVAKFDTKGILLWRREFGTPKDDYAEAIAGDATGVYVAGSTWGALTGQTNSGGENVFVRKYDADGNELWTRQFEAIIGFAYGNTGAFANSSGFYVVGHTHSPQVLPEQTSFGSFDAFFRKYNSKGTELWTRQFGTSAGDYALGVCADARNVYVVGDTEGAFPGQNNPGGFDVFIICFPNRK